MRRLALLPLFAAPVVLAGAVHALASPDDEPHRVQVPVSTTGEVGHPEGPGTEYPVHPETGEVGHPEGPGTEYPVHPETGEVGHPEGPGTGTVPTGEVGHPEGPGTETFPVGDVGHPEGPGTE